MLHKDPSSFPFARIPVSKLDNIVWPGIITHESSMLLSILYQLQQTQWWDPEDIQRFQFSQLQALLAHAYETVPWYRQRIDAAGIDPASHLQMDTWQRLPLLSRGDLQQYNLLSRNVPRTHGQIYTTQSSGSTGVPVKLSATGLNQIFWKVFTLRDHEWHNRDYSGKLASLRITGEPFKPVIQPDWGVPVGKIYKTGAFGNLNLATDISEQMQWLQEFNPDYLLSFPSNLLALMEYSRDKGIYMQNLREVRAISETVTERLRHTCRQVWNVPLTDVYSTQEVGYIALQCPEHTHFHVQSENVLVEILDDEGKPCKPGEIGKLVVTSLHNFATPLLRYDLQDRAEAGDICPCGRALPVIKRILGRERNMVKTPDGRMHWPLTGFREYGEITASIRQFQFIQHTLEEIEVKLVVTKPLSEDESIKLVALMQKSLGYPFNIRFSFYEKIPRTRNGKFEEFISHIK